jgi:hypothetical protein
MPAEAYDTPDEAREGSPKRFNNVADDDHDDGNKHHCSTHSALTRDSRHSAIAVEASGHYS